MITVRPANSTARPDVSTAVITASSGSRPGLQPLSISRDDEQRVVDAHPDADHRGERRREALQRVDVREQSDDREPDRDPAQRDDDRQHHREDRTERDQEDDDRGDETDALAGKRRPFGLLDQLEPPSRTSSCGVEECESAEVDHLLAHGVGHVLRLRVELRVRERDRSRLRDAIRRRVRIGHARDVRHLAIAARNACACCCTAASRIDGVPCITTCTESPDCALKFW